jgi:hypothetical protein
MAIGGMIWFFALTTVLVISVYIYGRITAPVVSHRAEQGIQLSPSSFVVGAFYGVLLLLALTDGSVLPSNEAVERLDERQTSHDRAHPDLADRAAALADAEVQVRRRMEAKRVAQEAARWASLGDHAPDQSPAEEAFSGFALPAGSTGPCAAFIACACGTARQFDRYDSAILARRYRGWCRDYRDVDVVEVCAQKLPVIRDDVRRNSTVLTNKGVVVPKVCRPSARP